MGYAPPTKTAADVFRDVKRKFGDESGVQLEEADLYAWLNEAQIRINDENRVVKAKSSISSVAGQRAYSLASLPIQKLDSLHYAGVRVPNMSFAQAEETIIKTDPSGTLVQAVPALWYEYAGEVTFWPTPGSVETITAYYTKLPTKILAEATLLELPDEYFEDVVNYVLKQAYEMDEDWEASQVKSQQLSESLLKRGEEERTAQNMTYETITVVDDYYGGY